MGALRMCLRYIEFKNVEKHYILSGKDREARYGSSCLSYNLFGIVYLVLIVWKKKGVIVDPICLRIWFLSLTYLFLTWEKASWEIRRLDLESN